MTRITRITLIDIDLVLFLLIRADLRDPSDPCSCMFQINLRNLIMLFLGNSADGAGVRDAVNLAIAKIEPALLLQV